MSSAPLSSSSLQKDHQKVKAFKPMFVYHLSDLLFVAD